MSSPPKAKGSKTSVSKKKSDRSITCVRSSRTVTENRDEYYETCQEPDFIYGGPFIKVEKPEPFLDTTTPINLQLQGTFKKSYAYYSLKERLPVILTKVIDYISREGNSIKAKHKATDDDTRKLIQYITKLKNDLVTNKKYDLLEVDTEDAKNWNKWIEECTQPHYFTNAWVFTECYVYRRLREGCELIKNLNDFDPFEAQKQASFENSKEPMCIVAEKLQEMLVPSEKDKRKADFITLLKICLWSNRCDLSLSLGEPVTMPPPSPPTTPPPKGAKGAPPPEPPKPATEPEGPPPAIDPFQLIIEFKDKLLVDNTNKIADQVVARAEKIARSISNVTTFKCKCSCHRLAKVEKTRICMDKEQLEAAAAAAALAAQGKGKKGKPPPPPPPPPPQEGEPPPPPPIPCPAKVTVPSAVQFDIVCDNAGYELFTDLCLAHFLLAQKMVERIRFHVKKMPWFISDVTPADFTYLVDACANASYSRTVPAPEPKPVPEGQPPPEPIPPRDITSTALNSLGQQWKQFLENGNFVVMSEDYWTYPHVYKDMKKYDYWMYRKLQYACTILFKGDLNYRKLLGERNCSPVASFEASLQGFTPSSIIALRTVKSDLICGLPRGKYEAITKLDDKWMQKGNYGLIQFCGKAEPLKVADRPCGFYCDTCMGLGCPNEGAFW